MSILIKNVFWENDTVDVWIKDGRFQDIGRGLGCEAGEVIDGTDKAILPSFFNCHTHAAMTLLRGYAEDMELYRWLSEYIWPLEGKLTERDVYVGSKLACLEMIKSGTTFFNDMYWHMPGTLQAVKEMGLRAGLSSVFIDLGDLGKAKKFRSRARRLAEDSESCDGRVVFPLGPHAIYTVSKDSLAWVAEFAREQGMFVHIHLSETQKEVEDCLREHGKRPVEYLEEIGLLGPNVLAAHGIWVDDREISILADHGVTLVHCPASNRKLASGTFNYSAVQKKGIRVALGTDGCASNNNLDMLEEMKFASMLAKSQDNDPTAMPAQEAFACATENGAAAFGIEAGKIEEGGLADCILVDLRHPQMVPMHNLISNMVYSGNGGCVDTTICNGRVLMNGRCVPGEAEVVDEARKTVTDLLGRR
ncbi:MAG: amidohydrolase [Desulfonatronovibrionaceae bacterium]